MTYKRRKPVPLGILTGLFLLLISCIVGCENGNLGITGGKISGSVVDSKTLTGIANVNVIATSGDAEDEEDVGVSKYTVTDSNGNYYLSDLRAADNWILSFEKAGYTSVNEALGTAISVNVANDETSQVPSVRMVKEYESDYVTVSGTLMDAVTGSTITYGTTQINFGQTSFSNRLPTELTTGFSVPASADPINIYISVSGYASYTVALDDLRSDKALGSIYLQPETYSIVGRWTDVPGWVSTANPTVTVFAYSGTKMVSTVSAPINDNTFTLTNIPKNTSVSVSAEIKGYKMNSPVTVSPTSGTTGQVYQSLSLKTNFSAIYRGVRVVIVGNTLSSGDYVGAYCEDTGTTWAQSVVTNPSGVTTGVSKVVDLGVNQVPTGYTFSFVGYSVEDGNTNSKSATINDDGSDAQVVLIQVN